MKKNIEDAFKTILSSEQVAALKEEIAAGMKKINSAVEKNEKMKAKKELLLESLSKADKLIETSERSPLLFKTFYAAAKTNIKKLLEPIIEKMMNEEEELSGLDDIPDASVKKEPAKKQTKKESEKINPAKPGRHQQTKKNSNKPKQAGK